MLWLNRWCLLRFIEKPKMSHIFPTEFRIGFFYFFHFSNKIINDANKWCVCVCVRMPPWMALKFMQM